MTSVTETTARSKIEHALLRIASQRDHGLSNSALAVEMHITAKAAHTFAWQLRTKGLVTTQDGTHHITPMGAEVAQRILTGEGGIPRISKAGSDHKPRRVKKARRAPARTAAVAAPKPAQAVSRAVAVTDLGDQLIAAARQAVSVHEQLLEEAIEMSDLVRATIAQINRSIDLIESAYTVARA